MEYSRYGRGICEVGAECGVDVVSRHTFPPETTPVAGEPFVFTEFSGEPQCFLTETQLDAELARAGFVRDGACLFTSTTCRSQVCSRPVKRR
jgi:hypothetical protein